MARAQQARRRRLRFKASQDSPPVATATVVTVKVEHVQQQRRRRATTTRKRRIRSRRRSPMAPHRDDQAAPSSDLARGVDGLPTPKWNLIRDLLAEAKSLGDIARVTLRFFREHEEMQCAGSPPAFPIFIPAKEVYTMLVPRKRRIYDVLHVLEGIGVIKRARCNDSRRAKGGYFLYFGKEAAIRRLAEIKNESSRVLMNFRRSCTFAPTVKDEDSALLKVFEGQAEVEKWPSLATTTTCFLSLLFQQDYQQVVSLPSMSSRLVEARQTLKLPSWSDKVHADVHRRVYDVVSVLASCSLVLISMTADDSIKSTFDTVDRSSLRKHVRFNYEVFTNPSVSFAADAAATQFGREGKHEKALAALDTVACVAKFSSPTLWSFPDDCQGSSVYSQTLHTHGHSGDEPMMASTGINFAALLGEDQRQFDASVDQGIKCDAMLDSWPETPRRSRPEDHPEHRIQDLFSPFGQPTPGKSDWCDGSLRQLVLQDALPSEDRIDWELTAGFNEEYQDTWGALSPVELPLTDRSTIGISVRSNSIEETQVELECHEILYGDEEIDTGRFLS